MIDVDGGTPETVWRAWAGLADLPPARWSPGRPVVVVAPHPDDEVLGVGGLLQLLAGAGHPMRIVAVTDGDASHPGSTVLTPVALAGRRRAEAAEARHRLGLGDVPVEHLGRPDGAVADHHAVIAEAVASVAAPDTIVLAPWRGDGHPDHEAAGHAAADGAAQVGATLVEYPVWAWNWAGPGDERVPWERARRIDLPGPVAHRKAHAIAAFCTQIEPLGPDPADRVVLPPAVLAHHRRPFEVVFS